MKRIVWLAIRLSLTRRRALAPAIVLGLAIALLTILGLATAAAPGVVSAQQQRTYARTPQLGADASRAQASLLALEPNVMSDGRWDGHHIVRDVYASRGGKGRTIPGAGRPPSVHEYYASPDLINLISHDPVVRALFSGKKLIGRIEPSGLTQPHELRAVIAVPASSMFMEPVHGFGATYPDIDDNGFLNISVTSAALATIWIPAVVMLIVASRLAARARSRRARALRLQGLSVRSVRMLMGAETMVVAVPAALVGIGAYGVLIHWVTRIPGTSLGYFTVDAQVPWPWFVAIAAAIVFASAASTGLSLPMERNEAAPVRPTPSGRAVVAAITLLVLGLAYLMALPLLAQFFDWASAGIWIAAALVAAGLAIAGPRLVTMLARRWSPHARSAGVLVGLRLSSWASTTAMRLGSLLSVLIVLMLGSVAFVNVLNGGSTADWNHVVARHPIVPITVDDFTGGLSYPKVAPLAHHHAIAEQASLKITSPRGKHHRHDVVFASCDNLRALTGQSVTGCTSHPTWLRTRTGPANAHAPAGAITLPDGQTTHLPPATHVTHAPGAPSSFDGALLLPARLAPTQLGTNSNYYLLTTSKQLDVTLATISSRSPTAQFDLGELTWSFPGTQQYRGQSQWITIGMSIGLMLGVLTLVAATMGESHDRRSRLTGMRILGAPYRSLLSAHYWTTAVPLLILGCAGTAIGWLVCHAIRTFDDRAYVPTNAYELTIVAVVTTAFVVATATSADARVDRAHG